MTIDDIRKAYAWQEALKLSKELTKICEEFSDADTNVLVWHLRSSVVDIPAGIAADLQAGRPATMEAVVKLVAALELVAKIYPAIETSGADEPLRQLLERMQSDGFSEREPEPEEAAETEALPVAAGEAAQSETEQRADVDNGDDNKDEEPAAPTLTPKVDGVGRQPSH